MNDATNAHDLDLLDELPKLAPPDDLVADVERLAFQELEASHDRWSAETVIVPRYESAVHAMLVAAYAVCAAQAALRVLQRFMAG